MPVKMSWLRSVVPQGYAHGTLRLEGLSPLLMNSPDADRESDLYRAYYILGQKDKKSLDDEARLREIEWELRIYLDADLGPYIPGRCVKGVLINAAGKYKKAATVKRSLVTRLSRIPLEYEGPRDQVGLWSAGYRYTTMIQNAGYNSGRVMRCRPMFPDWALTAEIAFDPEEIDPDTLALIVERSQRYGLCDYRPEKAGDFGQFAATLTLGDTARAIRAPRGTKARNGHEEAAHAVSVERLTEETLVVAGSKKKS